MYPAIEITLHLDRVCAAQRPNPVALRSAFRGLHLRHQPAPLDAARKASAADRRALVAGHTVRDVESGLNAGAAGAVAAVTLAAAGPTHVLAGVADVPALIIR
jgi:phosphoglycolate phosphatase-like HAD superfamily hydrolase